MILFIWVLLIVYREYRNVLNVIFLFNFNKCRVNFIRRYIIRLMNIFIDRELLN